MLILIADDLKANQAILSEVVKRMGHEVTLADNGQQAVEAVLRYQPHVILMDIIMPVMDGIEAITKIRELDQEHWIPIIVISSANKPTDVVKGIEAGADDYLTIPIITEIVEAKISAMLRIKQLSDDNLELTQDRDAYLNRVMVENDRYRQLKTAINESAIVVEMDVSGYITHVNDKFCQLSGYRENELLGKNHQILHSKTHSRDEFKKLWKCISKGKVWQGDICNKSKDGKLFWVRTTIVPFFDSKTNIPVKFLAIRFDLSEQKESEQALKPFKTMFEQSPLGIALVDSVSGAVQDVNQQFADISGRNIDEITNLDWMNIPASDDTAGNVVSEEVVAYRRMQKRVSKPNDEDVWLNLTVAPVIVEEDESPKHLCMVEDITQSKQHEYELQELAHYDPLTKLPNRTLFSKRYLQAIEYMKHTDTVLAICFIDLDHFKPVNDTYGHDVGDKLLIQVAKRVKYCIRAEDTLSRQGGDEFALILGGMDTVIECKHLLDRVLHTIAQPYLINEHTIQISASGGISIYPLDDCEIDTVLRHTDQAMYQAKLAGRNRYHMFNAADAKKNVDKHIRLQEVKKSLKNENLELYYQPKVNMKTGHAFGVEALIRWIHPTKGLIPPLDFLPVIEGTPVELDIGNWVIKEALNQADSWKRQGLELEISINISCRHLLAPDFVYYLEQALNQHPNIDPRYIQLEILESSVLSDLTAIGDVIQLCKDKLSIHVALDDFGTGYSSLTHLRHLAADTVKIDQSFVRNLLNDPNDYAIIDSVIRLSEAFDREIIAEGVETTEHGLMLMVMGCTEAQGYGIARPMPASDIHDWFDTYTPNEEWISCGKNSITVKDQKIKIITLTTEQWINAIEKAVLENDDKNHEVKRCHLGAWLNRLRNDQVFNKRNMTQIEQMHDVLFSLGDNVMNEYRANNIEAAKVELNELRETLNGLQELLEKSA
jgi:diguanylate cyclase (GGDEF)-like protein/PAS domain S-box-containing protein